MPLEGQEPACGSPFSTLPPGHGLRFPPHDIAMLGNLSITVFSNWHFFLGMTKWRTRRRFIGLGRLVKNRCGTERINMNEHQSDHGGSNGPSRISWKEQSGTTRRDFLTKLTSSVIAGGVLTGGAKLFAAAGTPGEINPHAIWCGGGVTYTCPGSEDTCAGSSNNCGSDKCNNDGCKTDVCQELHECKTDTCTEWNDCHYGNTCETDSCKSGDSCGNGSPGTADTCTGTHTCSGSDDCWGHSCKASDSCDDHTCKSNDFCDSHTCKNDHCKGTKTHTCRRNDGCPTDPPGA